MLVVRSFEIYKNVQVAFRTIYCSSVGRPTGLGTCTIAITRTGIHSANDIRHVVFLHITNQHPNRFIYLKHLATASVGHEVMAVHRFLTLEIKYSIMSTSLRDNLSLRGLSGVSRGKATCRSSVESAKFRYKCLASSVWTLARRELEPERLRCSCGDTFIQPEGVQLPLH